MNYNIPMWFSWFMVVQIIIWFAVGAWLMIRLYNKERANTAENALKSQIDIIQNSNERLKKK